MLNVANLSRPLPQESVETENPLNGLNITNLAKPSDVQESQTISSLYNLLLNNDTVRWNGTEIKIRPPHGLTNIKKIKFRSFTGDLLPYTSIQIPELNIKLKIICSKNLADYSVNIEGNNNVFGLKRLIRIDKNYDNDNDYNTLLSFSKGWSYDKSYDLQLDYNLSEIVEYLNKSLLTWLGGYVEKRYYDKWTYWKYTDLADFHKYTLSFLNYNKKYITYLSNSIVRVPYVNDLRTISYLTYDLSSTNLGFGNNYTIAMAFKRMTVFDTANSKYIFVNLEDITTKPYQAIISNTAYYSAYFNKPKIWPHGYCMINTVPIMVLCPTNTTDSTKINNVFTINYLKWYNMSVAYNFGTNDEITQSYNVRLLGLSPSVSYDSTNNKTIYTITILFGCIRKNKQTMDIALYQCSTTFDNTSLKLLSKEINNLCYCYDVIDYEYFNLLNLNMFSEGYEYMSGVINTTEGSVNYYLFDYGCSAFRYEKTGTTALHDVYQGDYKRNNIIRLDYSHDKNNFIVNTNELTEASTNGINYTTVNYSTLTESSNIQRLVNNGCLLGYPIVLTNDNIDLLQQTYTQVANTIPVFTLSNKLYNYEDVGQFDNFKVYLSKDSTNTYAYNAVNGNLIYEGILFKYENNQLTYPSIMFNIDNKLEFVSFIPEITTTPKYFNLEYPIIDNIDVDTNIKTSIYNNIVDANFIGINDDVINKLEILILLQYEYNDLMLRCNNFPNNDNFVFSINEVCNIEFKIMSTNSNNQELNINLTDSSGNVVDYDTIKALYGKVVLCVDWEQ